MIKLINPRGRVVEVDGREVELKKLYNQGFVPAPTGAELGKVYNPVFDRGVAGAKEQKEMGKETQVSVKARATSDTLEVKWI